MMPLEKPGEPLILIGIIVKLIQNKISEIIEKKKDLEV